MCWCRASWCLNLSSNKDKPPSTPTRRRRSVTEQEKRDWKDANRFTEIFYSDEIAVAEETTDLPVTDNNTSITPMPPKNTRPGGNPDAPALPAKKTIRKEVVLGEYADIDQRTATRFKRGQIPAEATLDLHGMNREQALAALVAFMQESIRKNRRKLLIITGKGARSENDGVLKTHVPRWLAGAEFSQHILAMDYARQKHGGTGALYVLLRRKRS